MILTDSLTSRFLKQLGIALLACFSYHAMAADPEVTWGPLSQQTLVSGQAVSIPFTIKAPAQSATLSIYSPDDDLVYQTHKTGPLNPGAHNFTWNGKDHAGKPVPDEVYIPVLAVTFNPAQQILDPRKQHQARFFSPDNIQLTGTEKIQYTLSQPARVQVRAGIENGPMVSELLSWKPQAKGTHTLTWNGKDPQSGISFKEHADLIFSVSAWSLPEMAIMVTGNRKENYAAYIQRRFPERYLPDALKQRSSEPPPLPYAFLDTDIPLHLSLDNAPITTSKPLQINKPSVLALMFDEQDLWMVNTGKFEVGFFVDYVFSSEAEQYFLPIAWTLYPEQYGKGEHVLSININGPYGVVASRHLKFIVP